jgi:hypothetical protein
MHFVFIKYSISLLLLFFLITGLYNLITDAESNDCSEISNDSNYCDQNYIISFTIANKRDHDILLQVQPILNIIVVIMSLFFFQYLRK